MSHNSVKENCSKLKVMLNLILKQEPLLLKINWIDMIHWINANETKRQPSNSVWQIVTFSRRGRINNWIRSWHPGRVWDWRKHPTVRIQTHCLGCWWRRGKRQYCLWTLKRHRWGQQVILLSAKRKKKDNNAQTAGQQWLKSPLSLNLLIALTILIATKGSVIHPGQVYQCNFVLVVTLLTTSDALILLGSRTKLQNS